MSNKETYKEIEKIKILVEKFKEIHKNYPNGGYDNTVRKLENQIANLSDGLYKNKENK